MPILLFVYGTLLQTENHYARYINQHCSYISSGKVKGLLYDLGEYPGMIAVNKNNAWVYGSVYQMDNPTAVLKVIDEYEGVGPEENQPNLYKRISMPVETPYGIQDAWVYLYNLPVKGLRPVPEGNYLEYIKQKKSPG